MATMDRNDVTRKFARPIFVAELRKGMVSIDALYMHVAMSFEPATYLKDMSLLSLRGFASNPTRNVIDVWDSC